MSPGVILQRLGLAPGASAHPWVLVPLTRWLAYGDDPSLPASSKMLVEQLGLTAVEASFSNQMGVFLTY